MRIFSIMCCMQNLVSFFFSFSYSFSLPPLFLSSSCTRELFYFTTLFALLELHSACIEYIKSMLRAYVIRKKWIGYLIATILLFSLFLNDAISFELYETIAKNHEKQKVRKKHERDEERCSVMSDSNRTITLIDKYVVLHEIRQDSQLTCHVCNRNAAIMTMRRNFRKLL